MKPHISVIVPIYNVEKYLDACIQSLINQTLTNIEIILVDDGSTDSSSFICDKYKKIDTRIKVIHKKKRRIRNDKKCRAKSSNRGICCVS